MERGTDDDADVDEDTVVFLGPRLSFPPLPAPTPAKTFLDLLPFVCLLLELGLRKEKPPIVVVEVE